MANKTYTLEDIRRLKHITALKMEAEKISIQNTTRYLFTPRYPKLWNLVSWNGVMTVCKSTARAVTIYKTVSSVFKLFRRR